MLSITGLARRVAVLSVLLPLCLSGDPGKNATGIHEDTETEFRPRHGFGFWDWGCDPSVSFVKAEFSITESLIVSAAVVDSLHDTIYSFGKRRLPPGDYEVRWNYRDRSRETLPFLLWLEVTASHSESALSTRFSARTTFCAPPWIVEADSGRSSQ